MTCQHWIPGTIVMIMQYMQIPEVSIITLPRKNQKVKHMSEHDFNSEKCL